MLLRASLQRFASLAGLFLFGLLLGAPVYGQGERATVTGLVTDSSRAIVLGAEVSIRNLGTNVVATTKTNSAGIYYLPALPPGRYELRVEQVGFKPAIIADIPLGVGVTATFNVTLEVGAVTESVEVQATAVQLEAQTTGLGRVLQNRSIAELPVLGRNPLLLVSVEAGVQPVGGGTVASGTNVKMSGGAATQNAVFTDGGESRGFRTTNANVVPLESVAEFRVDTATYAAEFGRSGGGVVTIATKSGTNALHGVVYEFLRNDNLNANSWTNNRSNVRRGDFKRNDFGVAIGGPIVRDRTFFFANYEARRQASPVENLNTVPTDAQRQGDFSSTYDRNGALTLVYDPVTTRPDPARPGSYIRDPFGGDKIPSMRLHPISLNVEKYWPAANRTGEGPSGFNNYYASGKRASPSDTWLVRVDHFVSPAHRLFGRFNGSQSKALTTGLSEQNMAFPGQSISSSPTRNGFISLTSTFSPSVLGELRLSYLRLQSNSSYQYQGFDITSLGFPASLASKAMYKTFPEINVSQYTVGTGLSVTSGSSAEVGSLSGTGASVTPTDVWQLQYHLTLMRNRHKIKAGTELELQRLASLGMIAPAGRYFFDRLYTEGPDPLLKSSTAGSGFASFLLGVPIASSLGIQSPLMVYGRYYSLYLQDDVRMTSKLTANVGVRWEYSTPWMEKWGRVGYFDFAGVEPVTGAKGTFKFAEPGAFQTNPNRKHFGPRVGLAYSPTSKTVIRAAAAIFFAPTDTLNPGTTDWGNGLYLLNEGSMGPPNPAPNTPPVGGSWSNPFAAGILVPDRTATFPGQNMRTFNPQHGILYVMDWTFNIQRMLTPTLVVQAGYVGTKMTHVAQNRMYNQNDPLLLPLGAKLLTQVPNPYYGKITSGQLSYSTTELRQVLRPYPQYLQVLIVRDGYGDENYNAFQLQMNKQYSHGLMLSVGYTVSKDIMDAFESATGETGPQDAFYNPKYSRSISPNDIPQRLVVSEMYELPFGKGRAYLSRGTVGQVIGNWQVSGIVVVQSGIPLRIAASDNTGLLDFGLNVGRANRLKDPVLPKGERTLSRYFDTSAFVIAPPFTMPTDSITQPRLRDFGRRNFDMSFIRNQQFKERYNVQFRAEFFNFFNTPALALGSGSSVTVNAAQFGQVLSGGSPREVQLGLRIVF